MLNNKPAAEIMTAMTFNVQCYDISERRQADLPVLIRKYMPDLIGIQEAKPLWMDVLRAALPEYESVGIGRGDYKEEHSAIFFRKDKFTLLESATKWLSDTPDVRGSKFEESAYVRICTYAVLRRNSDEKEFLHINTHLDWPEHSMKQIAVMFDIIKDKPYPVLLTGDFNFTRNQPNYQAVLDAGYMDTATVAKESDPVAAIDYLFFKAPEVEVFEYHLCDELINGAKVSDHDPVYIKFLM